MQYFVGLPLANGGGLVVLGGVVPFWHIWATFLALTLGGLAWAAAAPAVAWGGFAPACLEHTKLTSGSRPSGGGGP